MTPRVLLTRTLPGAADTARRLSAMGCTPVIEPLLETEHLPVVLPPHPPAYAFTSRAGAESAARLGADRTTPAYCVGDATALGASEAGFTDVRSASGDVEALLRLILSEAGHVPEWRTPLVHVANEEARGDLAERLTAAGAPAVRVAAYRTRAAVRPGPQLSRHLEGTPVLEAILLHSPKAAAALAALHSAATDPAPLRVAAISQAASRPLGSGAADVETSATPDEDGLLAALLRLLGRG